MIDQHTEIVTLVLLGMLAVAVVMFLVLMALPTIDKYWKPYARKRAARNKKLSDYPPIHDEMFNHITPMCDGLIDQELESILWRKTNRHLQPTAMMFTRTLKNKTNRYYKKRYGNFSDKIYKRALGTLRNRKKFIGLDPEFDEMLEKALDMQEACIHCEGTGTVWLPRGAMGQSENTCKICIGGHNVEPF